MESSGYLEHVIVITLDKKSDEFVKKKSLQSINKNTSSRDFYRIVLVRWKVIRELLSQGWNVINSDADAIWLNPLLHKIVNNTFDMQVSIGYGIPTEAVSRWGFTLCTGFMVFQSNARVIHFMDTWIELCLQIGDDQIAFNNILLDDEINWESTSISVNHANSLKHDLLIEAIHYKLISRELYDETLIFHPYLSNYHQNIKFVKLTNILKRRNIN